MPLPAPVMITTFRTGSIVPDLASAHPGSPVALRRGSSAEQVKTYRATVIHRVDGLTGAGAGRIGGGHRRRCIRVIACPVPRPATGARVVVEDIEADRPAVID